MSAIGLAVVGLLNAFTAGHAEKDPKDIPPPVHHLKVNKHPIHSVFIDCYGCVGTYPAYPDAPAPIKAEMYGD